MQAVFLIVIIVFLSGLIVEASIGDRSNFFNNCVRSCRDKNCTEDGSQFVKVKEHFDPNELFNRLLLWSCRDECIYHCMWRTTNAFIIRNWQVPQFFGKWPFKRFMGLQEPASVLFSILNLWAHIHMIKQFRKNVRPDSPMYYVWHGFCGICLNAWIWSSVFHARDYPWTEFLDYGFAYSMVLATFVCMLLRMFWDYSPVVKSMIGFTGLLFYLKDFALLNIGQLNYGYNMQKNVITGVMSGIGWITWYFRRRKSHKYGWKILSFQILVASSLLLELNDFPPILWTFDAHSLWHLSTVPITLLFYSFIIDDCKRLRQDKEENMKDKMKLI